MTQISPIPLCRRVFGILSGQGGKIGSSHCHVSHLHGFLICRFFLGLRSCWRYRKEYVAGLDLLEQTVVGFMGQFLLGTCIDHIGFYQLIPVPFKFGKELLRGIYSLGFGLSYLQFIILKQRNILIKGGLIGLLLDIFPVCIFKLSFGYAFPGYLHNLAVGRDLCVRQHGEK